jgi:CRP-like cAMP-binding protein
MPESVYYVSSTGEINRFLEGLPSDELELVRARSTLVHLNIGEVLYEKGGTFPALYFPRECVISVTNLLEDSRQVESATVGREGFAGLSRVLGSETSDHLVVTQVPGSALRLDDPQLATELPEFYRRAGLYADCVITTMSQSAACLAAHQVIERCARWLLETGDRTGRDKFMLTRQYLSHMLGASRQSTNMAVEALEAAKMIDYKFDTVTIRDRSSLEAVCCECYEAVRTAHERYLRSELAVSEDHRPL